MPRLGTLAAILTVGSLGLSLARPYASNISAAASTPLPAVAAENAASGSRGIPFTPVSQVYLPTILSNVGTYPESKLLDLVRQYILPYGTAAYLGSGGMEGAVINIRVDLQAFSQGIEVSSPGNSALTLFDSPFRVNGTQLNYYHTSAMPDDLAFMLAIPAQSTYYALPNGGFAKGEPLARITGPFDKTNDLALQMHFVHSTNGTPIRQALINGNTERVSPLETGLWTF